MILLDQFENSNTQNYTDNLRKSIKLLEEMISFASIETKNYEENDNSLTVDYKEEYLTDIIKIAESQTSIIYKVVDNRTKNPLCKKILKLKANQKAIKDVEKALKVFKTMSNISHPCICKSIGIKTSEIIEITNENSEQMKIPTIALFFDFVKYSLAEVLNMNIDNTFKVRIVIDVAHALNFLHKCGLIYKNLKMENIMLNSFFETKLVDFDLVSMKEAIYEDFSLNKDLDNLAYISPEMANGKKYDSKTDVYSFGVLLHVIFTGNLPKQELNDKILGKEVKLPEPSESISKFCIELIKKCLSFDPLERPPFNEILNEIHANSYDLASGVDPSILSKHDKELNLINNCT